MQHDFKPGDKVESAHNIKRGIFEPSGGEKVKHGTQGEVTAKHSEIFGEDEYDVTFDSLWGDKHIERVKSGTLKPDAHWFPYSPKHRSKNQSHHHGSSDTSLGDGGVMILPLMLGIWLVPILAGLILWEPFHRYDDPEQGIYGYMASAWWLAGIAPFLLVLAIIILRSPFWKVIRFTLSCALLCAAAYLWFIKAPHIAVNGMIGELGGTSAEVAQCPVGQPATQTTSKTIKTITSREDYPEVDARATGRITNNSTGSVRIDGLDYHATGSNYSLEPSASGTTLDQSGYAGNTNKLILAPGASTAFDTGDNLGGDPSDPADTFINIGELHWSLGDVLWAYQSGIPTQCQPAAL